MEKFSSTNAKCEIWFSDKNSSTISKIIVLYFILVEMPTSHYFLRVTEKEI